MLSTEEEDQYTRECSQQRRKTSTRESAPNRGGRPVHERVLPTEEEDQYTRECSQQRRKTSTRESAPNRGGRPVHESAPNRGGRPVHERVLPTEEEDQYTREYEEIGGDKLNTLRKSENNSQNSMNPAERTMMSKRGKSGDSRMKSKRYQILMRIGNKGWRRLSMWEEIALEPQEETKEEIIGQAELQELQKESLRRIALEEEFG